MSNGVDMDLGTAMEIICETHTRSDDEKGFDILLEPKIEPKYTIEQYVTAWRTLRNSMGRRILPTNPESKKAYRKNNNINNI